MGLEDDFPLWILQATIKIWRGAYYPQILGWSKAQWGLFCNQHSCTGAQYCPQRRPGDQGVKSASKTCFCLRNSGSTGICGVKPAWKWRVCDSKILWFYLYDFDGSLLDMIRWKSIACWQKIVLLVVRIVILLACRWLSDVIMMISRGSTMNWSDIYEDILRTHSESGAARKTTEPATKRRLNKNADPDTL